MKKLLLLMCLILIFTGCSSKKIDQNECSHDYGEWVEVKPSTCLDKGIKQRTCNICDYIQELNISELPHSIVIDEAVEPTCTTNGFTEGEHCEICSTVLIKQTELPAEHSYTEENIIVEATCTTEGTIQKVCVSCGATKEETVPPLKHSPNNNFICTRCGDNCPIEIVMTDDEKYNALNVQYISQRQIWHQDDKDRYVFVFSLLDNNEEELTAPAVVVISIINDNSELVYTKTCLVTSNDFSTWSYNNGAVKKHQATIYIYDNEISESSISDGDIYFNVYNEGYFSFSESSLSVSDLPLKQTTINLPTLPDTIHDYAYNNSITSSVKITEITYEQTYSGLTLYFTGEKTYDKEGSKYSRSCLVGWKLYDSENYIIDSGTFYSPNIAVGEKFRNEEAYINADIIPGETYTLVISNVD